MTTSPVRTSPEWLALREPADAAARAADLVARVQRHLPAHAGVLIRDLGCGTGSMGRWLAPRLNGAQHWIGYDRDADLLARATAPGRAADGSPVTLETRQRDVTRLGADDLAGASLITASALLDTLTSSELARLVATSTGAGCPVLITLSLIGHVELAPVDPLDQPLTEAFNAHQRRTTSHGRLLGPDAVGAAAEAFSRHGHDVLERPSTWRLGPDQTALIAEWLDGWVSAACEQRSELGTVAVAYLRRRADEAGSARLHVTVHHRDLLAAPR